MSPSMVAYWSALNYWNLSEQVPRITYVQTTARKENRRPTILEMKFRIVRVRGEKFFGGHRFSEDLDFTATEWFGSDELEEAVAAAFAATQEVSGIDFRARDPRLRVIDDEYRRESLPITTYC